MNTSELKRKVKFLMNFGTSRSEVFSQLSGRDVKDSQLALLIARYPDASLSQKHNGKVLALIALMFTDCAITIGEFVYTVIVLKTGITPILIWMALLSLAPLLFAWGFRKPFSRAYFAYVVFSLVYLLNLLLRGFKWSLMSAFYGLLTGLFIPQQLLQQYVPGVTGLLTGLLLVLAQIGFAWYVGFKLFPDLTWLLWPRKDDGRYVFSS